MELKTNVNGNGTFTVLCTSYNETENGFVLRNNWHNIRITKNHLDSILSKFDITEFEYPAKGEFSNIYNGKMSENIIVHLRVVQH